jgi:uncharacterized membrane protein YqaE (UPF0057 family)
VRYLIAILLPPLGLFLVGKWGQAILCLILQLTLIGWPIAAIWAVLVVNDYYARKRNEDLVRDLQRHGN